MNDWTFPCPCGGVTIGRFVIPTNRAKFAIIGTCDTCAMRGRDPTTTAIMAATEHDDIETLLVMCLIMFKEREK